MPELTSEAIDELPLFERFPRLGAALPRCRIGTWPTPVVAADRFAAAQGLPLLWIKREDLSHAEAGGNKIRGLEFILGEAARRGVRTLFTLSSAGSHHVCKTAWHARRLGIGTLALVVHQPCADYVRRNLASGFAASAELIAVNPLTLLPRAAAAIARARRAGPWMMVGPGGTSPLSCVGHVNAAFELKRQIDASVCPEPDVIFVAMGSLGTAAGLLLGLKLAGLKTRVVGVVVSYRWYCTRARAVRLARRTLRLMRRLDPAVPEVLLARSDVDVDRSALGRGYAHFTPAAAALLKSMQDTQGLTLDGTYTAKTLDAAVRYLRSERREIVPMFWHTFHRMPPAGADLAVPPGLSRYFDGRLQPLDGV